jgi:hypothetical protein
MSRKGRSQKHRRRMKLLDDLKMQPEGAFINLGAKPLKDNAGMDGCRGTIVPAVRLGATVARS